MQNDCNGSAKVALISIERSHHAWCVVADAARDTAAAALAGRAAALRSITLDAFPRAMAFVRPGFDEVRS